MFRWISGSPVYADVNMRHLQRLSIIIVNDLFNILCFDFYKDSIDANRFNRFIFEKGIKFMNEYPGDHSVWTFDNLSFHLGKPFQDLALLKGTILFPAVGYEPYSNPTEYEIGALKRKIPTKNFNSTNIAELSSVVVRCLQESPQKLRKSVLKQCKHEWILDLPD